MDADLIAMQKLCAESNFEVLSFSVDSLTGDETLTCGIPADKIPCGKRNAAKKYLATYVSAKNSKPSSTVTNPTTTEGEEYDGLWRHVSEGFNVAPNKREYLMRVLRKGYATVISWTEARLVEGKDLQETENYRTIRWLNCDAAKVNTMAASLSAASFADPVVKSEKLAGTWHNIAVEPSIAEDGSGIVTLFIAKPQFTLAAYQNYLTTHASNVTYLFQVPKNLAQALITAHKTAAGASVSCSYANASGLVDLVLYSKVYNAKTKTDVVTAWDYAHKEFTTTYYDLTEAVADALVLAAPPVGWRYEARKINKGDGSWEVVIVKRHALDQVVTSYAQNYFENLYSIQHTENAASLITPVGQVGKIKENRNEPTQSGNTKTTENVREAKEVIVAEHTAAITDDYQDKVERGHNAAVKPTISAVEGADVQLDYDINVFGRYDYVKKTRTSNIPLSCPGIASWKTEGLDYIVYAGKTWDATEKRYSASGEYVYRVTVWHGLAFYKTAAEAAAALPTIAAAIGGLRVDEGSGIYSAGSNLWQARVRSRNDAYVSFTNYGGPRWI